MAELTASRVRDDLRALGVLDGMTVMVHASLRRIGPVAGGADGIIDALDAAVGPEGTLVMNLGSDPGVTPFDARSTPAAPDVGILAEVFRRRAGTRVSDHRDGRFGARGAGAEALLAEQPWNDYYGPGSPLDKLVAGGGKVLRLGANPDTVTLIHLAEYLVPLEGKRRVRREHLVARGDGAELCAVECLDDSDGIVAWPGEDYFARILQEYLAAGRGTIGRVGNARSQLLDARDLVDFGVAWMSEHFRPAPPATPPAGGQRP